MLDPRRHAAALLAVLALSVPAPALAAQPPLLAQIDEATPTPTPAPQPPLTEEPPTPLDGEDGDGNVDGNGQEPNTTEPEPLPETGVEAGIVALLGLALIASGSGLRLTLARDGD